jgi:hypothetical protein
MTPAWRIAATLAAAVTAGVVVTNKVLLQPLYWRIQPESLGLWIGAAAYLLAPAVPALLYLWWVRRSMRTPATFQVAADGPAFVVPGSPVFPGLVACALMLQAGNLLPYERVPDTDRVQLSQDIELLAPFAGLAALMAAVALALIWLPAPSVRLTPDGIAVRQPLRARAVRWEELLPGGPHPAGRWSMRLLYDVDGRRRHCAVPVYRLRADAVYLASVVRHYAERPEHRAAIGTRDELDRLASAYAAWRTAPATAPAPA